MDIFVKRPLIAVVITLVLLFAGVFSLLRIPVLQFPQLDSASLVVSTVYPGSSARVVQGFITEPIERVAMTVPGVDYVDGVSKAGVSNVTVWLKLNEDSTAALTELSARLEQIRYELPADAEDPAVSVARADRPNALFYLDVQGQKWSRAQLTNYLERQISPQLASIPGVQRIGLEGGRHPAMRIWLDPYKLSSLDLTAGEVMAALRANNVVTALGKTENDLQQVNVLSNSILQNVPDFAELIVREKAGAVVRLGDIARVEEGEERGDMMARYNQIKTVYISVWPLPGANEIAIGDELYKRLDKINAILPQGMEINIGYDGTTYMRHSLREILTTLFETVLLVSIVVLALMGSMRSALVPLVAIPISILGSIAAMLMMNFSLNLLTILAIVLSVGLVVDDAIVVVENVARHLRNGKTRFEAALTSSRELLSPIIAMTFTLAAVYAPIGFVSGLTGSLFKEFAFTLAVAVAISGVVAVTLSPIMSAYVCHAQGREGAMTRAINGWFDRLHFAYGRQLQRSFAWHWQILFIGLLVSLLVLPFYLFSAKELAPLEDKSIINIIVEAPPDASVDYTESYMHDVIDVIQSNAQGLDRIWQVLNPGGGFGGIVYDDFRDRNFNVKDIFRDVFNQLAGITGLRVLPVLFPSLPTAGRFDVEMVVESSDSYENMQHYANRLIAEAYRSGKFLFADTDLKLDLPEVKIVFDRNLIADMGMDVAAVTQQLAVLLSEQDANRYDDQGKSYRVTPLLEEYARQFPDKLLDLQIRTPVNKWISLRSIARLETQVSPRVMPTFNQQRSFRVFGGLVPGTTNDQGLSILEQAASTMLPVSYQVDYAGVSRQLRQEGNSMLSVLAIALLVVYLALVVQFNSLRLPLVVLLGSVPLALSGAMLFSFLGFTTINIYAQIGFITLVGLIAKNAILITEFASDLQKAGLSRMDAIRQSAELRLRPVLMTTAATVLGHFPLVLVTGAGAEARNSIGIILVAGMALGTVFTLYILPHVYLLLARESVSTVADETVGLETGQASTDELSAGTEG